MDSFSKVRERASEAVELLNIVRYGIKELRKAGYTFAELGLRRPKKKTTKKTTPGKKDEDEHEYDIFSVPDTVLSNVADHEEDGADEEALIYDGGDEDDDD